MGRSRSRGRGRSRSDHDGDRGRSHSSSSSSSSEDSEERLEREREREFREQESQEKRAQKKAARKAERERAEAKAQAEREQHAAIERLGRATWRFTAAGDEDDDCFSLELRGKKPESDAFFSAGIVDCTSWEPLNDYLRLEQNFNMAGGCWLLTRHCSRRTAYRLLIIVDEKDKLLLKAKLEVDGEGRLYQDVRDATTLGTFWASCMDMGTLIVEAQASSPRAHIASPHREPTRREPSHAVRGPRSQEISVVMTVQIATGPGKLAKPKRQRGEKNTADELKFKDLVKMVYGEHPGHFVEGEWTAEATELLRGEPGWVSKHKEMAKLTEKVRCLCAAPSLLARRSLPTLCAYRAHGSIRSPPTAHYFVR